jgi:hypothetical protein
LSPSDSFLPGWKGFIAGDAPCPALVYGANDLRFGPSGRNFCGSLPLQFQITPSGRPETGQEILKYPGI